MLTSALRIPITAAKTMPHVATPKGHSSAAASPDTLVMDTTVQVIHRISRFVFVRKIFTSLEGILFVIRFSTQRKSIGKFVFFRKQFAVWAEDILFHFIACFKLFQYGRARIFSVIGSNPLVSFKHRFGYCCRVLAVAP